MHIQIKKTDDFHVTGSGIDRSWDKSEWTPLSTIGNGRLTYATRFKVLWSALGIYFLFDCEDEELTCTKTRDFDELYLEDVIEIFLWPDASQILYFEYEISPLGYELPLLVSNSNGSFHGWLPFRYDTDRLVIKDTAVFGGEKVPMAKVKSWRVEFYIPFKLLLGVHNTPPAIGAEWKANFCRIDYGSNPKTLWSWATRDMADNFHNYKNFESLKFVG